MRVSIIKSKKIQDILLPEKIEGNYWITDTDVNGIKRNLISVEADNDSWKLTSNKEVYCVDGDRKIDSVYLQNNTFYQLENSVEKSNFLLYCSSILTEYNYYDISMFLQDGIKIGNTDDCLICGDFARDVVANINNKNSSFYIECITQNTSIYVNKERVLQKKELHIGDVIFINGIKIILMIKKEEQKQVVVYIGINNIDSKHITVKIPEYNFVVNDDGDYVESDEEIEFPLYDEKEYYHRTPRFISRIRQLEVSVDDPPVKTDEQETSFLLTVGPMLTMSMMSLMTGYTALNNLMNGVATLESSIPSLVISGAMLTSVVLWPLLTKKYERKKRKQNEEKRQKKYSDYIESKKVIIREAIKEQTKVLIGSYPSIKEINSIILNRHISLWQRRIKDEDFLEVNLGVGSFPMKIDIKYPSDRFSMVEDNLKEMVLKLGEEPKLLTNVPVVFSLIDNYIAGLIGDEDNTAEYMRRLLLQVLALHSYDDLKIIVLTDEENQYKWSVIKNSPHCFTDGKELRFFATNNDEYKEICYYLDKIFNDRTNNNSSNTKEEYNTVYLVITDCFKKIKDFDIIENILNSKNNYGFSLFIIDNKIINLPDQCISFIDLKQNKGSVHNNIDFNIATEFSVDLISDINYELCIKKLANIPIELKRSDEGQLPNKLGFLEMYDVGKIEQLNSGVRWSESNPILNLNVPVGFGKNGEIISIDLHEKYHGPHGLIAGMTGSGKSEFIITYILSAAINYHPNEVQFVLIDYKGGGLAGAFENNNIGLKLPHLVGTITNLDVNEIKRSLASIESELKVRQELFNNARKISGDSTIDIYKYQKMYREGIVEDPVSHFFIISDEFAELKNQQPEFMEQLISTARIGRSLGVHLILATQKPSGVVDPQIWSNTRFRVCMRVQDKSDSNEVIKCPDAAYLKQTGRFYFQVGYNEVFLLGHASWAGGKYLPAEKVNKSIDTSINFINNIGYPVKSIDTKVPKMVIQQADGEELLNVVKYLHQLAIDHNIKTKPLWLSKIPAYIKIEDLMDKYSYSSEPYMFNPVVGEYDVPDSQEQKLFTLNLSKNGNACIYGASGSGKEKFISTTIFSSMITYKPEEINFYLIDFGSGTLKMFDGCPIIGDIINPEEEEKINNLFKMLTSTIESRKELFANYNGDYSNYCKNSGETLPNVVVIINNYESYQELYNKFDDILTVLTRDCSKYGIFFILTINTPNGVRFKLKQNFSLIYSLQQNQDEDYTTILGNVNKNYPTKIFGRGILKREGVFEFQTASIIEQDQINEHVKKQIEMLNNEYENKAKKIPVLPKNVTFKDISSEFNKTQELVVGMEKDSLEIQKFDFIKNYISILSSLELEVMNNFVNMLITQIIALSKYNLIVINADNSDYFNVEDKYISKYKYVNNQFDSIISDLVSESIEIQEKFKSANYDKSNFGDKKKTYCIIIGLDALKNKLNTENKIKFSEMFTNYKDLELISFVIVDTIDVIRKIEIEQWYKNCVNNMNGFWFGNGINDQYSIKLSQKTPEMKLDVPKEFCFVINRGKPKYIKYLNKIELKFKEENL